MYSPNNLKQLKRLLLQKFLIFHTKICPKIRFNHCCLKCVNKITTRHVQRLRIPNKLLLEKYQTWNKIKRSQKNIH